MEVQKRVQEEGQGRSYVATYEVTIFVFFKTCIYICAYLTCIVYFRVADWSGSGSERMRIPASRRSLTPGRREQAVLRSLSFIMTLVGEDLRFSS